MTNRINESTVVGSVLILMGVVALIASIQIDADISGDAGARFFPILGTAAIMGMGLLEVLKGLRGEATRLDMGSSAHEVLALFLIGSAYIFLMGKVGYLLATGFAAVAALWMFEVRNPLGLLFAALLCPAVYHVVFFELLGVFPPYGEWFDLQNVIVGY